MSRQPRVPLVRSGKRDRVDIGLRVHRRSPNGKQPSGGAILQIGRACLACELGGGELIGTQKRPERTFHHNPTLEGDRAGLIVPVCDTGNSNLGLPSWDLHNRQGPNFS